MLYSRWRAFLAAAALSLAVPALSFAAAPTVLPVQGFLEGTDGSTVNDVFAVTFTLYSDSAGTQQLWTEETPVNFVDGYFTAYLGSSTAIDLATFRDNGEVYLGVKVADDAEMTPFALGSSPFAGFAEYAGFAGDITDAAKIQIVQDVAVQLDNDGKVHDKYTDAEAIAAVATALSTDTTTLETALGTTDDANPLNHARYTDAEAIAALAGHTSDPAAHHARYTDAEAIAALGTEILQVNDARIAFEPNVFDCAAGNWCEASNAWGSNRFSSNSRYTNCNGENDCSANTITLALDNNQHPTVLLSHLDWSNTRHIDVELSFNGGANYNFHKRIHTYRRDGLSSNPYISTIRTVASNLPIGANVRVRLRARAGRLHFEGFALSKQILPEVNKEEGSSRIAVARNMADRRNTSATYVNVADRTVTHTKNSGSTYVRVSYQDSLGFHMTGVHTTACRWRLLIDGAQAGREQWSHSANSTATGWRIWPGSFEWLVPSVAAGTHTYQLQVLMSGGASECLNGWSNGSQENFFMVEELLP